MRYAPLLRNKKVVSRINQPKTKLNKVYLIHWTKYYTVVKSSIRKQVLCVLFSSKNTKKNVTLPAYDSPQCQLPLTYLTIK